MGRLLTDPDGRAPGSASEVGLAFLRLGLLGFGGPLAHVAMMRDEFVVRRRWLDESRFLDLVAATSALPGPSSTELALRLGADRAGRWGMAAAALAFIGPPALIVLAIAWLYVESGVAPVVREVVAGVAAVTVGIVAVTLIGLARRLRGVPYLALAGLAAAGFLAGLDAVVVLAVAAGAALVGALVESRRQGQPAGPSAPALVSVGPTLPALAAATEPVSLAALAVVFLKVGALMFGSGYVLFAFLHADLVEGLGWLTDRQLLDAVAVGQATPGPLFTSATFIGYLLAGPPGALVATVAIFAPAFVYAGIVGPVVAALRARPHGSALLDGLDAGAVGLMAGITVLLARESVVDEAGRVDALALALTVGSAVAFATGRVPAVVLVAAGALAALAVGLLGGSI